jgi:hypothetical protein
MDQMIKNEELLIRCKNITGWNEADIHKRFTGLQCNFLEALNFFSYVGRLPSIAEQKVINEFGWETIVEYMSNTYSRI